MNLYRVTLKVVDDRKRSRTLKPRYVLERGFDDAGVLAYNTLAQKDVEGRWHDYAVRSVELLAQEDNAEADFGPIVPQLLLGAADPKAKK